MERMIAAQQFIYGQLERYKQEFVETQNNKYLEVMNELNKLDQLLKDGHYTMRQQAKKIKELKQENEKLKKVLEL